MILYFFNFHVSTKIRSLINIFVYEYFARYLTLMSTINRKDDGERGKCIGKSRLVGVSAKG